MSTEPGYVEVPTLDGLALHIHEWFASLLRAGFSEDQALRLLAEQIGRAQAEALGDQS